MQRRLFCAAILFVVSGCRLDVTQTIDLTAEPREIVTYSETFDDEAFQATTQLGGTSAFGFDAAKEDGWDVQSSSGPDSHTFTFKRSFSRKDAEAGLARFARDSAAATPEDAFLIGPTAFIGLPITAATPTESSLSLPALLRPAETVTTKGGRKDPAFQLADARVNAAAVNSVVHVYVELHDATGVHRIGADFAEATALSPPAGLALRVGHPWPVSQVLAFWRNVGPYGVFDYEHRSPPLCSADPSYRKAWMFGVGVYANGAHIPEQLMATAGSLAESWLAQHPVKCP
jgi:hypothetical protein